MNKQFLEYFRCPANYVDFRLKGELLSDPGFFHVGPDLTCYGRVSAGHTSHESTGALDDVFSDVSLEENACVLPFDLDEVVENLRFERYEGAMPVVRTSVAKAVSRKTYYAVRPFLPTSVRKHLQRLALRGWDRAQFPAWPIDQTVDRLFDRMMACAIRANSGRPIPFIWFWPEGHSSCATMTHDVETAVGRDFCNTLMDLDDAFGIKASFQLIPEVRYEVSDEFLRRLRERGFEINVHDFNHDGDLFRNREEFLRRVARINDYGRKFRSAGYRSGVLYRNLDWYEFFDCSYDMSVPNVGHLDPQRGGCCTTKPYFIGKILEIPVVATQDYTLFNILRQYSMDLWEQQIQLILEQNGLISFIVHPDYLLDKRARDVYSCLLARLAQLRQDSKMWIALPRELNDWWRSRNQMRLVREGSTWQIEGPGAGRGRIAFARLENGRVAYSFDSEFQVQEVPTLAGSQPSPGA
ncbi:MAG TPA: hypothetical protein VIH67_07815 [Candidatus Acidoferrum sp.]